MHSMEAVVFGESACEEMKNWLEHTHAQLEKAPNEQLFPRFSRETTVRRQGSCHMLLEGVAGVRVDDQRVNDGDAHRYRFIIMRASSSSSCSIGAPILKPMSEASNLPLIRRCSVGPSAPCTSTTSENSQL